MKNQALGPVGELLSDPTRWTRRYLARNARGTAAYELGDTAVSWCLLGAATKCYPDWREYSLARQKVQKVIFRRFPKAGGIAEFNDNYAHRTVMSVVREAGI